LSKSDGSKKYSLATGDVVAFDCNYYKVNELGATCDLTLFKVLRPVTDAKKQAPAALKGDMGAEGNITVGRLKARKFQVPYPDVSGHHATIYPDSVEDLSSNGTFVVYGTRSSFVPVPAGTGVKIGDFELSIK